MRDGKSGYVCRITIRQWNAPKLRSARLQCGWRTGTFRRLEMSPESSGGEEGKSAVTGKKLRVLVVDDQPAVCEVVADSIQYAGHEIVGTARDGVEAVERAKELHPDLVVMDISMPRMNGVEAMKAILAAGAAKRVLLMSGEYRSLGVTREEMMRNGASGFMEKPFNVGDLFDMLDRWAAEVHA
jgi:CheY-like chemotaxis protein